MTIGHWNPSKPGWKDRMLGHSFSVTKHPNLEHIREHLREKIGQEPEDGLTENTIAFLEEKGFLYGERGKYLNLALPHNSNL